MWSIKFLLTIICVRQATNLQLGCVQNGKNYHEGEEVNTGDACLLCTCRRGTLNCNLRVCANPPSQLPPGCFVLHKPDDCCPQYFCEKNYEEKGIELRTAFNGDPSLGKTDCTINGILYAEGSAVPSLHPCEYCYCIGNQVKCLKPKCMAPIQGCTPIYDKSSCCPIEFNCKNSDACHSVSNITKSIGKIASTALDTTYGTKEENNGCEKNGIFYKDGEIIASSKCEKCYCREGTFHCNPLSCSTQPDFEHCQPLMADSECCPVGFACGSEAVRNVSQTENHKNESTRGVQETIKEFEEKKGRPFDEQQINGITNNQSMPTNDQHRSSLVKSSTISNSSPSKTTRPMGAHETRFKIDDSKRVVYSTSNLNVSSKKNFFTGLNGTYGRNQWTVFRSTSTNSTSAKLNEDVNLPVMVAYKNAVVSFYPDHETTRPIIKERCRGSEANHSDFQNDLSELETKVIPETFWSKIRPNNTRVKNFEKSRNLKGFLQKLSERRKFPEKTPDSGSLHSHQIESLYAINTTGSDDTTANTTAIKTLKKPAISPENTKMGHFSSLSEAGASNSPNKIQNSKNDFDEVDVLKKLAGCNIYGKIYGVGKIIGELSGNCARCTCTNAGVECEMIDC